MRDKGSSIQVLFIDGEKRGSNVFWNLEREMGEVGKGGIGMG